MKQNTSIHGRNLKWLTVILSLFLTNLLVSCSKSSDPNPKEKDKIITVSIEHEGSLGNYQGFLNVNGTLNSDLKRVNVSGMA